MSPSGCGIVGCPILAGRGAKEVERLLGRFGDPLEKRVARLVVSAFESDEVAACDADERCEVLLRDSLADASSSDPCSCRMLLG